MYVALSLVSEGYECQVFLGGLRFLPFTGTIYFQGMVWDEHASKPDGFWGMFTVNTNWHHFCKHRRSRSVAAWYKQEKIGVNYHILTAFGTLCQCLTANTFVFTMCCVIEYVCSKQITKVVDVEFGKMQFSTVRMEVILESMANHTAVCEEIPHTRWPTAVSSYEMQTSLLFIILFYFIYI